MDVVLEDLVLVLLHGVEIFRQKQFRGVEIFRQEQMHGVEIFRQEQLHGVEIFRQYVFFLFKYVQAEGPNVDISCRNISTVRILHV